MFIKYAIFALKKRQKHAFFIVHLRKFTKIVALQQHGWHCMFYEYDGEYNVQAAACKI